MGFTTDLLAGLAQVLENAGVGAWRPDGTAHTAAETPIVIASVPTAPDRVVVLTSYHVEADAVGNEDVIGVQARTRGTSDPRVVEDLDDAVFSAWQGLHSRTLTGGVRVTLVDFNSGAYLGVDSNGRHERSANYYVTAVRPSPNRT